MERAWRNAAIKLGVGSTLIVAVLGLRIVTATPDGVEAEVAELESMQTELVKGMPGAPAASRGTTGDEAVDETKPSLVSRIGESVREKMPERGRGAPPGDELVSCRLEGSSQFMRARDCSMRGGRATVFEDDP